ncbi:MAG: PrsW family glutamic-type intramembrane protease [Anaerolineales bacterium]
MSPRRVTKPKPPTLDWLTIAQFGLGAVGISLAWMLAMAALLGSMVRAAADGLQLFSSLADLIPVGGAFLFGVLLLPSTFYALRRILGSAPTSFKISSRRLGLAVLLFPPLVAAGSWAVGVGWGWLVLATHISAALILIAWLLWVALRDLQPGSAQRAWGAFGSGLAATPILAFVIEAIGLFVLILLFAIYIEVNPALAHATEALQNATAQNPDLLLQNLAPFFEDPFILFSVFISLSFFVPLIEELLKPLGVALLLRRELNEAQGFALGALCGAGYALVENLALNTQPETLFVAATGRIGATIMHIFTTALSGYALVRAKNTKQYLPLLGILALNIAIHGLWNGMVLLLTAATLTTASGGLVPAEFAIIATPVLVFLALACVLTLVRMNRRLAFIKTKARIC